MMDFEVWLRGHRIHPSRVNNESTNIVSSGESLFTGDQIDENNVNLQKEECKLPQHTTTLTKTISKQYKVCQILDVVY